jgi:hypothetical protein
MISDVNSSTVQPQQIINILHASSNLEFLAGLSLQNKNNLSSQSSLSTLSKGSLLSLFFLYSSYFVFLSIVSYFLFYFSWNNFNFKIEIWLKKYFYHFCIQTATGSCPCRAINSNCNLKELVQKNLCLNCTEMVHRTLLFMKAICNNLYFWSYQPKLI